MNGLRTGDHVRVPRLGYAHHGIYVGGNEVVHYSGELARKQNACIRVDSIDIFAAGAELQVVRYAQALPPEQVVQRARSRLGERCYGLLGNNCEHFARWCVTGEHASEQVSDRTAAVAGGAGTGAGTWAALSTVSAAGAVTGLSGAGVMSGLATAGSVVGAGAAGGLVALAAAPAAAAVLATRAVLKDDPALDAQEREARQAGRVASTAGALAGAVGSVGAVSAMGSVAGLSGAGITSGLAAIGGTVGGGMVAGTAMALAAPAVAAMAVGYGVYRVLRFLRG